MTFDYSRILEEIHAEVAHVIGKGKVADYIPELARVSPHRFGMAVVTLSGEVHEIGDARVPFSIQSISKLFALILALRSEGDALWSRVGREPSGSPFNSLVQLEHERGKPRNPFINAGALVMTDILCARHAVPENAVTEFLRRLADNPDIHYDRRVALSELGTSERNAAMAWFMKSFGNLHCPVGDVIRAYCHQCAIEMSCVDLARAMTMLANHGVVPWDGSRILDSSPAKRLNALMLTCGTYDAAGDFAFRVGLPAKSGVGGGIVALMPGECGVCVWSPALESSGNSLAGSLALELLTSKTGRSIF
ncbi:MAG: glutaminase [Rhodocyclaceae bacterium]